MYVLDSFETIDISLSNDKALQTRTDIKFVVKKSLLPQILSEVSDDYQCQLINGLRISTYESNYYDTIDLECYNHTRIKKPNRFKIRRRLYHNGNISFLEIKKKVKGAKTVKQRILANGNIGNDDSISFLQENNIKATDLNHVINVFYDRFTLISNSDNERVTIDTDIMYEWSGKKKALRNIAIIEIKQDKLTKHSKLFKVLSTLDIRQLSVSKYCVGMSLMKNNINTRGFNKKLRKVQELINSQS